MMVSAFSVARGNPVRQDVLEAVRAHRGVTVAELYDLLPQHGRREIRDAVLALNRELLRRCGTAMVPNKAGALSRVYRWEAMA